MNRVGIVRREGQWVVAHVYATHNRSPLVREALAPVLNRVEKWGRGLNVGCGSVRLGQRVINLDISPLADHDVRARAEALPFRDQSFDAVFMQELLEHLPEPRVALQEVYRVLVPGGFVYCQVPFMIGCHGRRDYRRWTREGTRVEREDSEFMVEGTGLAAAPATGCYRILVEGVAVAASCLWGAFYLPAKGLAAILLWPLKFLDPILAKSAEADRIAGGFWALARRP